MDLVITQELARAESQQGGRGRSRPPDPDPREDSGTEGSLPPGRPRDSLNPSPWGDSGAYQDPLPTLMTPALLIQ